MQRLRTFRRKLAERLGEDPLLVELDAILSGPERLLRVEEVAELCGLHRSTVYRLIEAGTLASVRIGGAVRVPESALR